MVVLLVQMILGAWHTHSQFVHQITPGTSLSQISFPKRLPQEVNSQKYFLLWKKFGSSPKQSEVMKEARTNSNDLITRSGP